MSNSNRKAALGIIGGNGMPPLGLLLAIALAAKEAEAEQGHATAFGSASPFSGQDSSMDDFFSALFNGGCGECNAYKAREKANAEAGTHDKPVLSGKKLAKGLLQVSELFYSYERQLKEGKEEGALFPKSEKAQVYEAVTAIHNHLEHIKTLVKDA